MQWLKLPDWKVKNRGFVPRSGIQVSKKQNDSFPLTRFCIVGSLRAREVAYSTSDCQGSNAESCAWRAVSSHSSHHPQEVLLAQFSLYVHKRGLKPHLFHLISDSVSALSAQYTDPILVQCWANIKHINVGQCIVFARCFHILTPFLLRGLVKK